MDGPFGRKSRQNSTLVCNRVAYPFHVMFAGHFSDDATGNRLECDGSLARRRFRLSDDDFL